MSTTAGKPAASPQNPFLELKSERVQALLPQLNAWRPHLGGLEGSFRFKDGGEALAFLRPLAKLLDAHHEPPSRLHLTGPNLSIGLGLGGTRGGVYAADLALAARISALRTAVRSQTPDFTERLG